MPTESWSRQPFQLTRLGLRVNGQLRLDAGEVSDTLTDECLADATSATNARFAQVFELVETRIGTMDARRYTTMVDSFIEHVIKVTAMAAEPTRESP